MKPNNCSPSIIAVIHQGDEYYLPFSITNNNISITPDNIEDIRIKVGNSIKKYSDGSLLYDNNMWLFPILQKNSLRWEGPIECQIQYKQNNAIITSDIYTIFVNKSMFNDEFE